LPDLANSLNTLAIFLAQAGRQEHALVSIEEAAGHYRRLAEAEPDAYLPDLAWSLKSLAIHLADVGCGEQALAAAQESADHYRRLAEVSPDRHGADAAAGAALLNGLAPG
jgi:hypothetical protein